MNQEERNKVVINIWMRFNSNIGALYSFFEKVTEVADQSDKDEIKRIASEMSSLFGDRREEVEKELASLFPSIDDLDIYPDIREKELFKEMMEDFKDTSFIEQVSEWEKKHPFKSQKFLNLFYSAFIDPPMSGVILRKSMLVSLITFLEILVQDVFVNHFLLLGETKEKARELASDMSNGWGNRLSSLEKMGLGTLAQIKYKNEIIEMAKRRNLLVHNDGVVDDDYLKKAPQKYQSLKPGSSFIVSTKYLKRALDIAYTFGFYLSIAQWKIAGVSGKEQSNKIDQFIIPALNKKRYSLVLEITSHLKDDNFPKLIPERLLVDRAIAFRELGEVRQVSKIVSELEEKTGHWSISVAVAVLTNNFSELQMRLKNSKVPGNISYWPLFDPIRNEIWFRQLFVNKNKAAVKKIGKRR